MLKEYVSFAPLNSCTMFFKIVKFQTFFIAIYYMYRIFICKLIIPFLTDTQGSMGKNPYRDVFPIEIINKIKYIFMIFSFEKMLLTYVTAQRRTCKSCVRITLCCFFKLFLSFHNFLKFKSKFQSIFGQILKTLKNINRCPCKEVRHAQPDP